MIILLVLAKQAFIVPHLKHYAQLVASIGDLLITTEAETVPLLSTKLIPGGRVRRLRRHSGHSGYVLTKRIFVDVFYLNVVFFVYIKWP